ncbi:hypothetical protein [Aeromonas media]|nr:hypothetical protein [Aeromonas media]MCY9823472.1 hypothetical protein [Aeromonas media]
MQATPIPERAEHLLGRVQRPAVRYHRPSLSIPVELAGEASAYI